jgi:hypothetical protein
MKINKLLLIFLSFILFFWGLASIIITVKDVINNEYFKEIDNIKSLNNPEKYMIVDALIITKTHDRDEANGDSIKFDIEGTLVSNGSRLRLAIGYAKYIDFVLKQQPLYKSKLTGRFFLKDAPKKYYEGKYRGLYFFIFLKIAFYPIILFLIHLLIKYQKNKIYRL